MSMRYHSIWVLVDMSKYSHSIIPVKHLFQPRISQLYLWRKLWGCMGFRNQWYPNVTRSLWAIFGMSYFDYNGLNWREVQHSTPKQMGNLRLLISASRRIYVVFVVNCLRSGRKGLCGQSTGIVPSFMFGLIPLVPNCLWTSPTSIDLVWWP